MSDYGSGAGKSSRDDKEMVLPGSPDSRQSSKSSYGRKVKVTTAPNTGIQGSKERGNKKQTTDVTGSMPSRGRSYKSSYGSLMGSQVDNSVGAGDEYDYAKGRRKKGSKRKHVKAQEA